MTFNMCRDESHDTSGSVSVLLHINGKHSSRKRCDSNFSACVIGGSEKEINKIPNPPYVREF